jgi:hypothetical protein
MGFTGSFPDFRRNSSDSWDLLSFTFHRDGGALVITLARCLGTGIDHPMGHVPASKARVVDRHPMYRKEIGVSEPVQGDEWFRYRHLAGLKTLSAAIRSRIEEASIWHGVSPNGSEAPYAQQRS